MAAGWQRDQVVDPGLCSGTAFDDEVAVGGRLQLSRERDVVYGKNSRTAAEVDAKLTPDLHQQSHPKRGSTMPKKRDEALAAMHEPDMTMAEQQGRADQSLPRSDSEKHLDLEEGYRIYKNHLIRPKIAGGPRTATLRRYDTVFSSFLAFARGMNIQTWTQVRPPVLQGYAAWLEQNDFTYTTQFLELSFAKQIVKFLALNDHLPKSALFSFPLRKPAELTPKKFGGRPGSMKYTEK